MSSAIGRVLVVALCTALALIAALVAGILTVANGNHIAGAFLTGGSTFLVALPVTLVVAAELRGQ